MMRILVVALFVMVLAGCGGSSSPPVVVPPVLVVESSADAVVWTKVAVVDGRASVPAGDWHRVYPDTGETVSARADAAQDSFDYTSATAVQLRGSWAYSFAVKKEGSPFQLTVTVDSH